MILFQLLSFKLMDSQNHLGLTEIGLDKRWVYMFGAIFRVHFFPNNIKGLFVELNFRKSKWFLLRTHHPPSQSNQYYYENVDKLLHMYGNYQKFLLTGDFNEISDYYLETFLYQHELQSLSKEKTCFKTILNPSCKDLFLTNNVPCF